MIIIDANIILRYLLDDHIELSQKATEIIEEQSVIVPMEVACEVVYVLQKVYEVERTIIEQQLKNLLITNRISMEKPLVFIKALEFYGSNKLDFVDCLLLAYSTVEKKQVFTFDKKLSKKLNKP